MPLITVVIKGAKQARFEWNDKPKSLSQSGDKWSGSFKAASGIQTYYIEVQGQPGDPWESTVSEPQSSQKVNGKMSKAGVDSSGTKVFHVD